MKHFRPLGGGCMEKNVVISRVTILLGTCLLIIGIANILGYINLSIVDDEPPSILYTYPQSGIVYSSSEVNEIVVYVQDLSGAYYIKYYLNDKPINLTVTPYTKIDHPMIIEGRKYPDVTKDGYVDEKDNDLVSEYLGADATKYPEYDLNNDGEINTNDLLVISYYWRTVSYSSKIAQLEPGTYKFSIEALDYYGNLQYDEGFFMIENYEPLLGTWIINNVNIANSSMFEVTEPEITISFIKDISETTSDEDIDVTITVNNKVYKLEHVSSGTWKTTLTLTQKYTQINLKAISTTGKANFNSLTVYYVQYNNTKQTIGTLLIFIGILLIIGGLFISKK